MKLKVCGMRNPANISQVVEVGPDFIGFIFYPKSSRYVADLDPKVLNQIPSTIKKVGVFVNEDIEQLVITYHTYRLDYVQLHGDEDLAYVKNLKAKGISIIKVFRIADSLPTGVSDYQGIADLFLFDTDTSTYGGSGRHFDWNLLKQYDSTIPYLISGGIEIQDVSSIKELKLNGLVGIDVNSKFETAPALKNIAMVNELKNTI